MSSRRTLMAFRSALGTIAFPRATLAPSLQHTSRSAFSTTRRYRPTSRIQWHDVYRQANRNAFSSFASKSRPKGGSSSSTNWQSAWQRGQQQQQQKRQYARPMFNQSQFQMAVHLFKRWAAQPTFYYQVAGLSSGAAVIYIYNLEEVPVSGRRRFNVVSPSWEKSMGQQSYQQVLQEYGRKILPSYSKEHRMVQRVLQRLLPHSGLEGEEWEIHVIDDDMKNAFVVPGGKVFVFRGILDICQGEDGLAAVLGHEIAHNVAHHAAERLSQNVWLMVLPLIASLFGIDAGITGYLGQIAFSLPGSRSQEQEADYIGLLMMAESCYDPEAAMGLWARMEQEEKKMGGTPPQFMSTHPSSHNRLEKIRGWLPKAEEKMAEGGCANVKGYVGGFTQAADLEKFGLSSGSQWR